jgi:hypothetical protein
MSGSPVCPCRLCQQQPDHPERTRHRQLRALFPYLDERQRRWVAGLEAQRLGHGGIRLVATITGVDDKTIRQGIRDLKSGLRAQSKDRIRRSGAGRPRIEEQSPLLRST